MMYTANTVIEGQRRSVMSSGPVMTLSLLLSLLQILWSYGRRGNDDFFVYHGFVLGDNPDEDVVLFDHVQQLLYWAVQHVPQLQALRDQEQQLVAVAGGVAGSDAVSNARNCVSCQVCCGKHPMLQLTLMYTANSA
jgi:hypothetical protein